MADRRFQITRPVEGWLDELNAPPPEVAAILEAHADHPSARMMTHVDVGRLLAVLVVATGGRRVLEIGTFVGVSTVWMALALPPDGVIDTLEISDEHAGLAAVNFDRAGVAGRVRLHRGPAGERLAEFPAGTFDLAYVDADKSGYPAYLEACARLVRPGGVIVADNLFLDGRVANPGADDAGVAGIREAARRALASPGLATAALSIGDGVLLVAVGGP